MNTGAEVDIVYLWESVVLLRYPPYLSSLLLVVLHEANTETLF